jgi:hypothetical protein
MIRSGDSCFENRIAAAWWISCQAIIDEYCRPSMQVQRRPTHTVKLFPALQFLLLPSGHSFDGPERLSISKAP